MLFQKDRFSRPEIGLFLIVKARCSPLLRGREDVFAWPNWD